MEPDPATSAQTPSSRAWYGEPVADFLARSPDSIVGTLARNADFAVVPEQRDA